MKDENKTKKQLITELAQLRQEMADLNLSKNASSGQYAEGMMSKLFSPDQNWDVNTLAVISDWRDPNDSYYLIIADFSNIYALLEAVKKLWYHHSQISRAKYRLLLYIDIWHHLNFDDIHLKANIFSDLWYWQVRSSIIEIPRHYPA